MKSKAKAYVCGYIFRFNLSPLALDVFFLSVFGSFLEKIKSRILEVRSIVGLISLKDGIAVQIHGL